jgi:predicted regulator of Ras-like GTPase activity (Roadblock/LC7/MglB family)
MIDSVQMDDRITKCEKLLSADPKSQIFAALAEAYRKKGDLQKAQEVCLQGLKVHPDYSSARVVLAKIYMTNENFDLAWEELRKAIGASGRTRSTDLLETEILLRKGQRAAAAPILERLHLSDPENENVKSLMALMNEMGPEKAVKSFGLPLMSNIGPEKSDQNAMTLYNVLGILKILPKVTGTLAVGYDGLTLESRIGTDLKKEELAALSKLIFDGATMASSKAGMGKTHEVLIETTDSKIWMFAKEKFIVVLLTKSDVSLGALKLRVEDLLKKIEYGNEGESK